MLCGVVSLELDSISKICMFREFIMLHLHVNYNKETNLMYPPNRLRNRTLKYNASTSVTSVTQEWRLNFIELFCFTTSIE